MLFSLQFLFLISQSVAAEEILLSRSDFNQFHQKCSISQNRVDFSFGSRFAGESAFLEESQSLAENIDPVVALIPQAFENLPPFVGGWPAPVKTYHARHNSLLNEFASFGGAHQPPSPVGEQLVEKVDEICDSSPSFRVLGKFAIKMKIGQVEIDETLEIEKKVGQFGVTEVVGVYDVPNDFNVPISSLRQKAEVVSFFITVKDDRQDFTAKFEVIFSGRNTMSGNVLIDDEVFGTFTGERLE